MIYNWREPPFDTSQVPMTLSKVGLRATELHRRGILNADTHSSVLVFIGAMMVAEGQKTLARLALIMLDQVIGRLEQVTNTLASRSSAAGQYSTLDHPLTEAGVPGPGMPSESDYVRLGSVEPTVSRELGIFRAYETFISECRKHARLPGRPEWLVKHLEDLDYALSRPALLEAKARTMPALEYSELKALLTSHEVVHGFIDDVLKECAPEKTELGTVVGCLRGHAAKSILQRLDWVLKGGKQT